MITQLGKKYARIYTEILGGKCIGDFYFLLIHSSISQIFHKEYILLGYSEKIINIKRKREKEREGE